MALRVLHVVTHMNRGGLETMLMNYYRCIDRTQIQFDFLTHREYKGDFGEEIEALGGRIYHLPFLNPMNVFYKKALRQFFYDHPEYEIVHVHLDCLSGVVLKEAARQGVPVRIAHSHNSSQDRDWKYPIKLFYRRMIPKYASELMACSSDAGRWMFQGASFTILKNAIDAAQYRYSAETRHDIRKQFGIEEDRLVVGHVGRFSAQKNHIKILEVFRKICLEENALLLLIGDGELRSEIEKRVNELNIAKNVVFTGLRSDVPALMQAMDVFLFPSRYEGLGIAAVEAQAAGLPCVLSDKVPAACKITSAFWTVSLESSADVWAEQVLTAAKELRCDRYAEVKAAGYDIASNVELLQKYYQRKLNDISSQEKQWQD